jgi:RNA polymerase sigma factor (sigma-70 family)
MVYEQTTALIVWQSEELEAAPKPVHTENKAAARRRRQMERQQQRQRLQPVTDTYVQMGEAMVEAVESAQAERLRERMERFLDLGIVEPAPDKRVSQAKLTEWFLKWNKPIKSWLRNRASVPPGDVDDLAQEVFVRLLKYSDQVLVDNPQGYLFRIASNVANEWTERSRVRRVHDPELLDDLVMDSDDQPDVILERMTENDHILAAVDELLPRRREILLSYVNGDGTYKELAAQHGMTPRMVLRDLTNAYSTLRRKLR